MKPRKSSKAKALERFIAERVRQYVVFAGDGRIRIRLREW
jgi:hypothetical protein